MTISNQVSSVTAEGNGSTTSWTFTFLIPTTASCLVQVYDTTVDPATTATISSSQFSVTGIGVTTGGAVTYPLSGSALTSGQYLTVSRNLPAVQETSIRNQGNFYPVAVENALDYLTMLVQQLNTDVTAIEAQLEIPGQPTLPQQFYTVNSLSALRALAVNAGSLVYCLGHTTANDGGGGQFIVTSTNPGTDDNGFNIHMDTAGLYAVRQLDGAFVTPEMFGAAGDGTTNDTTAIQNFLNCAIAYKYFDSPDGYAILSTSTALTLSSSDTVVWGRGPIIPIANGSGYAPNISLLVSGNRNTISLQLWNYNDLTTAPATTVSENSMDAIRVTGSYNLVQDSEIWNFVSGVTVRAGTANIVRGCKISVKQKLNLGWSNDGIVFTTSNEGRAENNQIVLSTSSTQRTLVFTDVTGASTSMARCGITADVGCFNTEIIYNTVGEGFTSGIYTDGSSEQRMGSIIANTVFKQVRNSINAAGGQLLIANNFLSGSFSNGGSATLEGVIGSLDSNSTVQGNFIFGTTASVNGIHIKTNASSVKIANNYFIGTFQYLVKGICSDLQFINNTLTGTCNLAVYVERTSTGSGNTSVQIIDNVINGVTAGFVSMLSGMPGWVARNKVVMLEGYTGANGFVTYGGDYGVIPSEVLIRVQDNEATYVGTTSVTGTFRFVFSSAVSGSGLRGFVQRNSFSTSIFGYAIGGTFVTSTLFTVSENFNNTLTAS
jgi:hypothetical protein